jgi:hypothetical protein
MDMNYGRRLLRRRRMNFQHHDGTHKPKNRGDDCESVASGRPTDPCYYGCIAADALVDALPDLDLSVDVLGLHDHAMPSSSSL